MGGHRAMIVSGTSSLLFLLAILVVGVVLFAIIFFTRRIPKGINREEFQEKWLEIENSVTDDYGSQQLAILNADRLLDKALKLLNYKGDTMGERMTSASRVFSKREAVWTAHKLRNKLAHEDGVKLHRPLTKKVLASFKQALKDLGAL